MRPRKRPWTIAEVALLGTMPDQVLASRVGRTTKAVIHKRTKCGIATLKDRQGKIVGVAPLETANGHNPAADARRHRL
jgi:hypothetical protein